VQSTFGHLRTLGYLKLDVEGDRVSDHAEKQIWLWAKTPTKPSRDIQDLIEEVDEAIGQTYSEVIGEALHDHLAKGPEVESALGNWITDAMRWRTGADVGLQNTGGIRDDIHAGPISREDIFRVSPFRNTVVVFSLSGQQIKDLLEHDIEKGWDRLQVSGLKYTYRPRSVAPYGKRVMSVEVLGEKVVEGGKVLLPEKTYSVVSNNYLVGHAEDKYFGFAVKKFQDTGRLIHEVLMDWLRKHRLLDYREEGRIVAIRPPGSSRVPGG
ncbi:MAG: bifunctional metallophosphatase/5'-nucleotidase, partial [Candidatus Aminicenantales bacterium]